MGACWQRGHRWATGGHRGLQSGGAGSLGTEAQCTALGAKGALCCSPDLQDQSQTRSLHGPWVYAHTSCWTWMGQLSGLTPSGKSFCERETAAGTSISVEPEVLTERRAAGVSAFCADTQVPSRGDVPRDTWLASGRASAVALRRPPLAGRLGLAAAVQGSQEAVAWDLVPAWAL